MKWKQFLTPVASVNGREARELVKTSEPEELIYLDVRQPKEYEQEHLPGAKLIPLGELDQRLNELDPEKPTIIYWAIGGRSRVAAQMLAGKGYTKIYNLSGGIKAWEKVTATGPEDQGMELFTGKESAEESIIIAYGLEEGLRDFYLTMEKQSSHETARSLFAKLAQIETLHQKRLLVLYNELTGTQASQAEFSNSIVSPALEGGMTTEEYLSRFNPDPNSITDIVSLAMAIEAQALDLYQRASDKNKDEKARGALQQIAAEERTHIQLLADYVDQNVGWGNDMAAKQLVLIGGGHAHMVTLAKLRSFTEKGYGVTVIQPSDHHYYSGMGPGMLGGTYMPHQIRFNTRKVVEGQGGCFIRDKARMIDPVHQFVLLEKSEKEIPYDVLSCNAGSYVPRDGIVKDQAVFTAKPIEGLLHAQEEIIRRGQSESMEIAIVGGGPSSIEIAGNIWQLIQQQKLPFPTIRIFAGTGLMGHLPEKIGRLARKILLQRGIEIIEGSYVKEMGNGSVLLENGRSYKADLLFPAVGVKPSKIFSESGLSTGPDGGLLVNEHLQSVEYANIFGGGDCIYFQPQPLDKVGVYAVRENPVLYQNLMAALDGDDLIPFSPGGKYLLIYNLGCGVGIFCKWSVVFSGRFAFWLKDYIDRKFINTFQAGENDF